MALKTKIKVGEVNNLSDARYCAGMGVDMIGFDVMEGNKRFVDPYAYAEITEWIEGVDFILELHGNSQHELTQLLDKYKCQGVQTSSIGLLQGLGASNLIKILKVDLLTSQSTIEHILESYKQEVDYFLFEAARKLDLNPSIKSALRTATSKYPIILGAGFNAQNVESVLEDIQPLGLNLKGGTEIRPGFSDLDELADMLEILELED